MFPRELVENRISLCLETRSSLHCSRTCFTTSMTPPSSLRLTPSLLSSVSSTAFSTRYPKLFISGESSVRYPPPRKVCLPSRFGFSSFVSLVTTTLLEPSIGFLCFTFYPYDYVDCITITVSDP